MQTPAKKASPHPVVSTTSTFWGGTTPFSPVRLAKTAPWPPMVTTIWGTSPSWIRPFRVSSSVSGDMPV